MLNSFRKYLEEPTIQQISHTSVDKIPLPVLYACQDSQFNYEKANQYGYSYIIAFLTGTLTDSDKISWKGKYGNVSSLELQNTLYDYDHSKYSVVTETWRDGRVNWIEQDYDLVFIQPYGYCIKVNMTKQSISIRGTNRTTLLLVEPSRVSNIRIMEMDNARHEFGPTGEDTFDAFQYLMKISITDRSIHNGKICTEYTKQVRSYGKCIEDVLRDELVQSYGCVPSWLPNATCELEKNITIKDMASVRELTPKIFNLIKGLDLSMFNKCLPPCMTMNVHMKKLLHTRGMKPYGFVQYNVADEATVLTQVYAYDIFSLVVDLGSAVGLWLGLCALSIFDYVILAISRLQSNL